MKYLFLLAAAVSPLVAQEPGVQYKYKLPPPKPLTPQEELATFKLAPGFKIQLVASEPLIEAPIAASWDEFGRMYVVEMRGFMHDINADSEKNDQSGVISLLTDTNGDGVMDSRTTFAEGLALPRAVMATNGGALVAEPPNLWFMKDTNGDGKADVKELVDGGFGSRNGQPEHMSNSPTRFLDNWVYCANHGARYRLLPNGKWMSEPIGSRGQWGTAQDNYGRQYFNSNQDFLRASVVSEALFRRNPNLGDKFPGVNVSVVNSQAVWPAGPTPGVNRGGEGAIDAATQKLKNSTATCGPSIYRGDLFGKEFVGNAFVPEPAGNLLKRFIITEKPDGSLVGENFAKGQEFLTSTDERFRPVYAYSGPDGALYLVDMYRGILQHKAYLTPYLKENIKERKLEMPVNLGRIWRIVPENAKNAAVPKLPKETLALVPFLGHENGWVRDTAQRLLVERQDKSVVNAIAALTKNTTSLGKIHALWTLEGLNSLNGAVTGPLLKDPDPKVRAVAVRLADRSVAAEAAKLASEPSIDVKIALGFAAGSFPETMAAIPALVNASGGNAIVRAAIASGLRNRELEALEAMLAGGQSAPEAMVSDLAAAVMSEQKTARVKHLVTLIAAQPSNSPAQSAMLSGIAKGAKGSKLFYLDSQPPELAKLAATLDSKNKPLLEGLQSRIGWPGKPGMPPPPVVIPLTADEQKLFDAGKQVYATVCAACHQPNGRGQDGLAPTLVDSDFVTGKADIIPRIVLHGISGPIKVNGQSWALDMPPLGMALSDEQIAGVATYLRREWEHNASVVSVAEVAKLRSDYKTRTQTWTAEELGVGATGGRRR